MGCGGSKKKGKVVNRQEIPNIPLDNGVMMPMVAQGIVSHEEIVAGQIQTMVEQAISVGHRHFDSAPGQRETELGNALRNKIGDGTVMLEEIFITSKVANTHHSKGKVRECLQASLTAVGLPYLDLYLIHTPMAVKADGVTPDRDVRLEETWQAMEELYTEGLTKAIGIANFNEDQIKKILDCCKIKPAVLQIECHPYFVNKNMIEFCRSNEIHVMAYGPFGCPNKAGETKILEDPVILEVAAMHAKDEKTAAQVVLRFLMQMGLSIVTRGIVSDQQMQNITFFDMVLADDEEEKILAVNKDMRLVTFAELEGHPDHPFIKTSKPAKNENAAPEDVQS